MCNGSLEQQTVDQVIARVPSASSVLRSYGIDPTNRMSLAQAAAAVSVTPDALLAVLEDQLRRRARQHTHDELTGVPELERAINA
jgi:iron-sulfur cluster repair protein YtfE (RIC family)